MSVRTTNWLVYGGIATATAIGGIEGADRMIETPVEREVKYATAVMVSDTIERSRIQAEEIEFRRVGEEVKSKRTETLEVYKGDMVTTERGRARQFKAHVFSAPKYFHDPDGDSLMALDLTVREVAPPTLVEQVVEGLKGVVGMDTPRPTHDRYIKAGPYAATWFDSTSWDYTIATLDGMEKVGFKALHNRRYMSVSTVPTNTGMKQTWVLADSRAAKSLKWKVDSSAPMIHGGGKVLAGQFTITAPIAWDADSTNVPVAVSVSGDTLTYAVFDGGKRYPITVDPTAIIADTDATTGVVQRGNQLTYEAARDSLLGVQGQESSTGIIVGQSRGAGTVFTVMRSILRFNTSSLGNVVVSGATLKAYCEAEFSNNAFSIALVQVAAGTDSSLFDKTIYSKLTGWAASGSYSVVYLATSISSDVFAAGDTLSFALNADGKAAIHKNGVTQFMMMSSKDISATNPSPVTYNINEYAYIGDDNLYLAVTYSYQVNPPTNFRLTGTTTTGMTATFTPNYSANVDSVTIRDSAGTWIAKLPSDTDSTITLTGLTPATQYILKAQVDSLTYSSASNLDTLYTLAAAPTANFAEIYTDSTKITIAFSENGNSAATTYAIRDSTNAKWIDASGNATVTKTWRTAAQWATTATINGQLASVKHLIGVVAKNGDGIETAYSWKELTIGNAKYREISAIDHYTTRYKNAAYLTSRNDTTWANIYSTATNDTIGQRLAAGDSTVFRAAYQFVLPTMDDVLACSLKVVGVSDQSTTDFRLFAGVGSILNNNLWDSQDNISRRHFAFSGFSTTAFTAANMLQAWSTSSYGASIKVPFTLSGLSSVYTVRGDTLRMTVTSSADSAVTRANGYITVNTPKLGLWYVYTDKVPTSVTATAIASDSILVTWADNSTTETGFALVDAYTGLRIGGNDSTTTNATSKRMGGLLPNKVYNIKVKVLGGKITGDVSTEQDSTRTWAALPPKPTVSVITIGGSYAYRTVTVDTSGIKNPASTQYAVYDSLSQKYVYYLAGVCSLGTSPAWYTFAQMGHKSGTTAVDTVAYPAGNRSAFQIYSKNSP